MNDLEKLYAECFPNDSEAFRKFFFSKKYETVTVYRDGQLLSAAHLVPKRIMLSGKAVDVCYISGLGTRAEFRGQGIARETTEKCFSRMAELGYSLCMLSPFNNTYYHRYGFVDISLVKRDVIAGGKSYNVAKSDDLTVLCQTYNAMCGQFDNYQVLGEADFADKIKEYSLDGAECNIIYDEDEKPLAFGFVSKESFSYCIATDYNKVRETENLKGKTFTDLSKVGDRVHIQAKIINKDRLVALFGEKSFSGADGNLFKLNSDMDEEHLIRTLFNLPPAFSASSRNTCCFPDKF